TEMYQYLKKAIAVSIGLIEKPNKYVKKASGFFKYLLNMPAGIEEPIINKLYYFFYRYGIYTSINPEHYKMNCLVSALYYAGIPKPQLDEISLLCKSRKIPIKDISKIVDIIKCNIVIKYIRFHQDEKHKFNTRKFTYSPTGCPTIEIGSIDDHYFIIEKTNITKFALDNILDADFIQREEFNFYVNIKKKDKRKTINSFNLVKYLIENKEKFLTRIKIEDMVYKTNYYDVFDIDEINKLEINNNFTETNDLLSQVEKVAIKRRDEVNNKHPDKYTQNQKDMINSKKYINFLKNMYLYQNEKDIGVFEDKILENKYGHYSYNKNNCIKGEYIYKRYIFLDFETNIYSKIHEPYLCCCNIFDKIEETCSSYSFYGKDCGKEVLELVKSDDLIIIHNAGYDVRFLMKYLTNISMIEKNNRIMSLRADYLSKTFMEEINKYNQQVVIINNKIKQKIELTKEEKEFKDDKNNIPKPPRINIKDSLSIIPMKLSSFGQCFGLRVNK
ncbi:MAG: hypothetical protein KDH96_11130, partial [Candidatus Riesia sp.]|nr:hypothetical protein [Candidatus Riesia sp.]